MCSNPLQSGKKQFGFTLISGFPISSVPRCKMIQSAYLCLKAPKGLWNNLACEALEDEAKCEPESKHMFSCQVDLRTLCSLSLVRRIINITPRVQVWRSHLHSGPMHSRHMCECPTMCDFQSAPFMRLYCHCSFAQRITTINNWYLNVRRLWKFNHLSVAMDDRHSWRLSHNSKPQEKAFASSQILYSTAIDIDCLLHLELLLIASPITDNFLRLTYITHENAFVNRSQVSLSSNTVKSRSRRTEWVIPRF